MYTSGQQNHILLLTYIFNNNKAMMWFSMAKYEFQVIYASAYCIRTPNPRSYKF